MEILHIITGLNVGGAESMLYKLIKNTYKENNYTVISLTKNGLIGEKIKNLGVEVINLNMKKSITIFSKLFQLKNIIKNINPDIVQTWMYHSDLIGGIVAKLAFDGPIVWNIRHSDLDPNSNKKTTILTAKLSAKLSNKIPNKIISCSKIAKSIHIELGYNQKKITVIPNGFNINEFNQKLYDNDKIYEELKIPQNNYLIGMVGRYDPQKDYMNLLKAAKLLKNENRNLYNKVRFILCGRNVRKENKEITQFLNKNNLSSNFYLLGQRDDIPQIMASLDLFTLSSSFGEGFPNVIGEAMASNTPCVVTDIGDSAYIVGDTGIVVEPKNSNGLMKGWQEILSMSNKEIKNLGERARHRIVNNFDISEITDKYLNLYRNLLNLKK